LQVDANATAAEVPSVTAPPGLACITVRARPAAIALLLTGAAAPELVTAVKAVATLRRVRERLGARGYEIGSGDPYDRTTETREQAAARQVALGRSLCQARHLEPPM